MIPYNREEINTFVIEKIKFFQKKKIHAMLQLDMEMLIEQNPYFLVIGNINSVSKLIDDSLEAFLSSSEEKLFGDFLEELAVFIASKTTGGHKSTASGMDLEFESDGTYYVISIKSGPN